MANWFRVEIYYLVDVTVAKEIVVLNFFANLRTWQTQLGKKKKKPIHTHRLIWEWINNIPLVLAKVQRKRIDSVTTALKLILFELFFLPTGFSKLPSIFNEKDLINCWTQAIINFSIVSRESNIILLLCMSFIGIQGPVWIAQQIRQNTSVLELIMIAIKQWVSKSNRVNKQILVLTLSKCLPHILGDFDSPCNQIFGWNHFSNSTIQFVATRPFNV